MELRHLRYFLAVAEELNFSRAAQRLHIAQPPLSQQIRQLEDELGLQLLERGSRPLRLTEAGRFFKVEAVELLAKLDQAVVGTRRIARGDVGWIGIGYIGSAMALLLPQVLRRFHAEHPGVEVLLFEMLNTEQGQALIDRRIHVAFARRSLDHEELVEETLYDEPMVIAVPVEHPLAARESIAIAELAEEPFVLYGARSARQAISSDILLQHLRAAGVEPKIAVESQYVESALGLVGAGMGVTLTAAGYLHAPRFGVRFVRITAPAPAIPLRVAYRSQERAPAVAAFLKIVREVTAQLPPF